MNDPLANLSDIEGLDSISWWPPAIGWWLVAAIIVVLISTVMVLYKRRRDFKRSWKQSSLNELKALKNKLNDSNGDEIIADLAEILRRIIIHTYPRRECASIEGEKWLKWLQNNDKNNFPWLEKGQLLTSIYAQKKSKVSESEVNILIEATKKWII